MKWHIEYDNDTGACDGYFVEWWNVTNNEKFFRCRKENDAEWLLEILNSQEDNKEE